MKYITWLGRKLYQLMYIPLTNRYKQNFKWKQYNTNIFRINL